MIQLALPLAAPLARARRSRPVSSRPTEALARLARHLARRQGARGLAGEVRVVFNRRLRTAVGRADFSARTIELNPRLLDRHPEELLPTLVHELAHLVAGPRAGHGPAWRRTVTALGGRPEVCHRLDVADLAVRRRVWIWRCDDCGETYPRSHRKAWRYLCGDCGGKLRVTGRAAEPVAV